MNPTKSPAETATEPVAETAADVEPVNGIARVRAVSAPLIRSVISEFSDVAAPEDSYTETYMALMVPETGQIKRTMLLSNEMYKPVFPSL